MLETFECDVKLDDDASGQLGNVCLSWPQMRQSGGRRSLDSLGLLELRKDFSDDWDFRKEESRGG